MTLLRHRTVEDARREQLAEQVASMTHLSVGAVRGRISRANGHSLLRKVFVDVWPSALEELGALPAHALLREPKTIAELAEKLGASDQVVKRLLAEAAPATSTRKAVSTLWPSMSALGLDAIGQLRASEARSAAARSRIAAVLGISQAQVGRALSRAHGLSRIETIFEATWPRTEAPAKQRPRSAAQPAAPRAKFVAERYELKERLGEGGSAVVWLARDLHLARKPLVALKFLSKSAATIGPAALIREFEKATVVTHPNLCKYIRKEEDDERGLFLVIEYGGQSLREVARRPQPVGVALPWLAAAAEATDFLHGAKIWHLDIKPANILLDDRGVLRLTDFGIAKGVRAGNGKKHTQATSTIEGMTPQYSAPEMTWGDPTATSDQYSLAATFCELVAGDKGRERAKQLKRLDVLERSQNEAIHRALAVEPSDRFPSCVAFTQALMSAPSWLDLLSTRWSAFLSI